MHNKEVVLASLGQIDRVVRAVFTYVAFEMGDNLKDVNTVIHHREPTLQYRRLLTTEW